MPSPIDWGDEPPRMRNILGGVGCPHGRFDYCYVCEQLEREAQEVMENEGGTYFATSGENAGHWTEGPPPPPRTLDEVDATFFDPDVDLPFEDADQDRYDSPDPVESGETPEGGEFVE